MISQVRETGVFHEVDLTDRPGADRLPARSLTSLSVETTPWRSPSERRLQEDIDKLKKTSIYRERYESAPVQELVQAIEILDRLKQSAFLESSGAGYQVLLDAKLYLDEQLQQHLQDRGE